MVKVFIENEAGSNKKNMFNEKTCEYLKTVTVSAKYPYPYGFILNTVSGDGDNLDCFIITNRKLRSRQTVDVEPIGVLEQKEDGKEDHNILARLINEEVELNEGIKKRLKYFLENVFKHRLGKKVEVGHFLGVSEAKWLIEKCTD